MAILTNAGNNINYTATAYYSVAPMNTFNASSLAINNTEKYSPVFTKANTLGVVHGVLVSLTNNLTATDITVTLQKYESSVWTDVTSNVFSVTSSTPLDSSNAGSYNYTYIRFDAGHIMTDGINYRVKFVGSATGTTTTLRYVTGATTSVAVGIVTTTGFPVALTSSDDLIITGDCDGNTGTVSVTTDTSASLRYATLNICSYGRLYVDNTSSASGLLLHNTADLKTYVHNRGEFIVGNPASNNTINMNTGHGMRVWSGATVEFKGYPKFGADGSKFRCRTTVTANAGTNQLVCNLDVQASGWVAGDNVIIQGTNNTTAYQHESMTISSVSGSIITLTGNLANQHLSNAEVCNMTRNIKVSNTYNGVTDCGICTKINSGYIYDYHKVIFSYCEFTETNAYLNVYTAISINISVYDYIGTFDVDGCSATHVSATRHGAFIRSPYMNISNTVTFNPNSAYYIHGVYLTQTASVNGSINIVNSTHIGKGFYIIGSSIESNRPMILNISGLRMYNTEVNNSLSISNPVTARITNSDLISNSTTLINNNNTTIGSGSYFFKNCNFNFDGVNTMSNATLLSYSGTGTYIFDSCNIKSSNIIGHNIYISNRYDKFVGLSFINCNINGSLSPNYFENRVGTVADVTLKFTSAYAKGGSGNCVALTPTTNAVPMYYKFSVPFPANTAQAVKFFITKTPNFTGTVQVGVFDNFDNVISAYTDITTNIPDNDGSGNDWTYEYSTGDITSNYDTEYNIILKVERSGTITGDYAVFVDDITIV